MTKKLKTRPPHEPTDAQRKQVEAMAGYGIKHDHIGSIIGIDAKTLRKHYRESLDLGMAKAHTKIGGALFNKAIGGDTTALIFWAKTQMGFKERQELDLTSSDGSMTPQDNSQAVLDAIRAKHAKPE